MKSLRVFAKSRTIRLLIGFFIVLMIQPGAAFASHVSLPNDIPEAQFTASVKEGQFPLAVQDPPCF